MVVLEGEQRETDVGEDKVLSKEVDQLKQVLGSLPALVRHVDVGVVGLHDPTEQHCHDSCVCVCVCVCVCEGGVMCGWCG